VPVCRAGLCLPQHIPSTSSCDRRTGSTSLYLREHAGAGAPHCAVGLSKRDSKQLISPGVPPFARTAASIHRDTSIIIDITPGDARRRAWFAGRTLLYMVGCLLRTHLPNTATHAPAGRDGGTRQTNSSGRRVGVPAREHSADVGGTWAGAHQTSGFARSLYHSGAVRGSCTSAAPQTLQPACGGRA